MTATGTDHRVTAAQLALWAEEQVAPSVSSSGYLAVVLNGAVRPDELRAAALAVLHRHEPLRSVLRLVDGALSQVVLPAQAALFFDTVPTPCPPGTEQAEARAWMGRGENARRWDLGAEAPIRFHHLVHETSRRTLVFSVHHAGFDGRSKFVVARDFTAFLAAIRDGRTPDVPALPQPVVPEADQVTRDEAVAYWAEALAGAEPMALPAGRTTGRRGVVSTATVALDPEHVRRLRALARSQGTTTFTTLVAALARQLAGYGNPRPVLGIAADVSDERTRDVAGVQVNVVPMLVPAGRHHPGQVGEAAAALERLGRFRRVPFADLQGRLPGYGIRRLATQLGISFPRPPAGLRLDVAGLDCRWEFFTPNTSATFGKTLHLRAAWPDCLVRLDYRAETMGRVEADDFVADFRTAVATLVAGPGVAGPRRPAVATGTAVGVVESAPDSVALLRERAGRDPLGAALVIAGQPISNAELVRSLAAVGPEPPPAAPPTGQDRLRWIAALLRAAPRAATRAADRVVAQARGGPGGVLVLCPTTVPAVVHAEALAAWLLGASVVLAEPHRAPDPGARRICAPFICVQRLAEHFAGGRWPAGPTVDLVLPVRQLQVTAALAGWRAAGARLGAHHVVHGELAGWVEPGDDPLRPPDLTPAPGVGYTVHAADGAPVAAGVAGRLRVTTAPVAPAVDTGDAGRIVAGNLVEYLGTADGRQLRHSGFIDVGLVEAVLHAHPAVREAVVVLQHTRRGPSAVAVVVPVAGRATTPGEIRASLRRQLEGFDLPGRIQLARELPRAADGEIERSLLTHPVGNTAAKP